MPCRALETLITHGSSFGEQADVICLDNFFTSQKTNVSHLLSQPNFELLRHDVVHPIWLEVDEIYNLACPAAPGHYQFNPIKTLKTSVVGAINVLGMAKRCRAKVLQASTSEVYGDPEVHPQTESYRGAVNPVGPRACYDEGKRAAETLFMDYHRMNRVNIRIAHIFNTYGPRMHPFDGRVVSNFILQALEGKPLTIFGDGSQTRSFCYRDDLVEGLIRLMNAPDDVFAAGEYRQSRRVHDSRIGEAGLGTDRVECAACSPAAAARRSHQASARYCSRPSEARLATDNSAAQGSRQDNRVVSLDRREPIPSSDAKLLASLPLAIDTDSCAVPTSPLRFCSDNRSTA